MKIEKNKTNNDGKVLIANFSYLTLLQIASYIFPLITMPYLARVIGVEGFGKIAFAAAIIVWFQTITDWGFDYTATRDIAKNRHDKDKMAIVFSNVFWSKCLLMTFSMLIMILMILIIPKFRENLQLLIISFLLIPGRIMFPDWFFQAIEKMKYITILSIFSKLLFTIAVFVFIKKQTDYILQPLFVSLGYIISGIIAMYLILVKWGIKVKLTSFTGIFQTIKDSFDVFINTLMPNLYNSLSIVILGFFGGATANGQFDSGTRFIRIAQEFLTVISRTFYPFLSRRIDKHNLYTKINIYISLFISFVLFVTAPLLIRLFFTEEFYDSIIVLQIMSISIIFISLSNIYGTNYMIIQGFEKQLRNITFMCSVFGLIISIPLINCYSYIGAALTITITRGVLGLSIMFKARQLKKQLVDHND